MLNMFPFKKVKKMKTQPYKSLFIMTIFIMFALHSSISFSGYENYLKKGVIQNHNGEDCWYTQKIQKKSKYFFDRLTQIVGIITFDNPNCMSGEGFEIEMNKMMINLVISRWYSRPDAKFKTRVPEMYKSSYGQIKGKCIQSSKYPMVGITVDYMMSEGSILKVIHGLSIQGCLN